jgi:tetratricopeptide (TPR) repeat protein
MYGVEALKNMEYDLALIRLRPYEDYNTAVAYVGLNRNASALSILSKLERTAEVNYLLAIIYARQGKNREAVEHYVEACRQNRMFIHRGNLDPEISALIQTYQLNKLNGKDETDDAH